MYKGIANKFLPQDGHREMTIMSNTLAINSAYIPQFREALFRICAIASFARYSPPQDVLLAHQ